MWCRPSLAATHWCLSSITTRRCWPMGPYPYAVKKRVGGDFGHLTNAQARQFLDHADTTRLKMLFVAHISQQNNQLWSSLMLHCRAGPIWRRVR